ncbi:hypothetical protein WICMUC_003626 [Wickerhamomyces mucosus]|uniref:Secreted protein n=1 Tax=Wickerhamomyces mucosus TaxID=1378264 RepID=A0A9P8TCJ3_9ASCO|nr:hypothetical protein WICMUC_003626 [Wickerhamomyces mucosus]
MKFSTIASVLVSATAISAYEVTEFPSIGNLLSFVVSLGSEELQNVGGVVNTLVDSLLGSALKRDNTDDVQSGQQALNLTGVTDGSFEFLGISSLSGLPLLNSTYGETLEANFNVTEYTADHTEHFTVYGLKTDSEVDNHNFTLYLNGQAL